jgi:hypothetical protein
MFYQKSVNYNILLDISLFVMGRLIGHEEFDVVYRKGFLSRKAPAVITS